MDTKTGIHKPYIMFRTLDFRLVHVSPKHVVFERKTKDSIGITMWSTVSNGNCTLETRELIDFLILMGKQIQDTRKLNEELQDELDEHVIEENS